ncbi:MAG: DNA mismatch repair endonuclease MutL, partial [Candidatus Dormiibacterota bacterium]
MIAAAPIRRLPQVVADAIAAGEVIERPASVLKELVENALDAAARRIDIAIEGGGLVRIAVVDDGSGIAKDDLELAVERHATSKIAVAGDIARVDTLGFRGEALASIAAVSDLRLTTCTRGAVGGATLHVRNGEVLSRAAAASGPGTRVEVCELFAASPARLRF